MSEHPSKPLSQCQVNKMDRSFGPQEVKPTEEQIEAAAIKSMENFSALPEGVKLVPAKPVYTIKDHVKGDVEFVHYRDGNLWYECINTGFLFPVPTSDTGNATFLCRDKAMLFMRYIRKHMELKNSEEKK